MQKQTLQKLFQASQKVYRPVQIQNKNLSFFSDQNQFTKHQDIINNYRHTQSFTERLQLTVKYALNAYLQSQNPRYLSELGSLTSDHSVEYLREQMRKDDEGQLILKEQPRVNNSTVDLEYLLSLEKNTFGYAYGHFMNSHKFNSEDRPVSRYIQDLELAYIFQRYKEIHDFIHVLLGYDVTVKDELIVKWFEMVQLQLPSAALSSFVAPLKLSGEERCDMFNNHVPQVIQNAKSCKLVMNIYFEKYFEMDFAQFRKIVGIKPNPHRDMF